MKNTQAQVQQQKLTQEQVQIQSAIQVLSAKLTELPIDALRERLENELNENPYLEARHDSEDHADTYPSPTPDAQYDARQDYNSEDDIPDYLLRQDNGTEAIEIENPDTQSFYDQLIEQANEYTLTPHQRKILLYIIGNLDDAGMLTKPLHQIADELSIYHDTDTTPAQAEQALHILWQFEPIGVGARTLQECLLIQCRHRGHTPNDTIIRILTNDWDSITHNNWRRIQTRYNLSDIEVDHIRNEIKHLNPRPGSTLSDKPSDTDSQAVTPDFTIDIDTDGEIHLSLNEADIPTLTISDDAMQMINQDFVKTYVTRGRLFINAILQRRQTMLKTMTAIIHIQKQYFKDGDESKPRPMKLDDISKLTGQDTSTISRVCNNKYVSTPYGTYPLKWYFSRATSKTSDTDQQATSEQVATRQIKAIIKDLIQSEPPHAPYSDDDLAAHLNQQGYQVARRTIAKYREILNIPNSRMRRH